MKFCGAYTVTLKNLLRASAVSGHNVMTISKPGWGKTEMALQSATAIAGDSGSIFVELDPSTPPETIRGSYDPAAMLNGKLKRIVDGTPYDPNAKIIILDELWRANDVVFDALVHATNNKKIDPRQRPVFWGTSNFVGKAERTEALRDRFAMWLHIEGDMNPEDVSMAHLMNGNGLDGDWSKGLPSWENCIEIRNTTPTQRSAEIVMGVVVDLHNEAIANKFDVNPRRVVQWSEIVYRMSCYLTGTNDFTKIPLEAASVLRYAYPCVDRETSTRWAQVVSAIADKIGSAIDAYQAVAIEKFRAVQAKKSAAERSDLVVELGTVLAEAERELKRIGGDDPRVDECIHELMGMFSKAVRSEKL